MFCDSTFHGQWKATGFSELRCSGDSNPTVTWLAGQGGPAKPLCHIHLGPLQDQ